MYAVSEHKIQQSHTIKQDGQVFRYMDMGQLKDAVCLRAYCNDDRQDLKTVIAFLIDEAHTKEIVPSFIDFSPAANSELAVTLYGYPRHINTPSIHHQRSAIPFR